MKTISGKPPNCKKELLKTLATLWKIHPELRLFQLLELVSSKLTISVGKYKKNKSLFYLEDQDALKELKKLKKLLK